MVFGGKVGAVLVLAALAGVLLFMALLSSGPPGAPTAAISATPNPSAQTTYTVTVSYQEYSTVYPSYFGWNGQAIVASAYWTAPNGAKTVVEQDQHLVASVLSSSGDLYTIGATFSFTVNAQCTTTCGSSVMNVTVTAYGINPTGSYWSSATGPASTITFSNVAAYNTAPASIPAPLASPYYVTLLAPLVGAVVASLGAVTVARPNAYTAVATGLAAVVGIGVIALAVIV